MARRWRHEAQISLRQLDRPRILASEEISLRERRGRPGEELPVSQSPGDPQCTSADLDGIVQLPAKIVQVHPDPAELTAPTIIPQPLGETLSFAQARQRPRIVALIPHGVPELHANIEPVLQRGPILGEVLEGAERVLE